MVTGHTPLQSFPFWTPVEFSTESSQETPPSFSHFLLSIGEWSDRYLSLAKRKIVLTPSRLDAVNWEMEEKSNLHSFRKVLMKVISWSLLAFVALPIKCVYKYGYLNPYFGPVTSKPASIPETPSRLTIPSPVPKIETPKAQDEKRSLLPEVPQPILERVTSSKPGNKVIKSTMIGKTKISLKEGNLTDEPADIIVNAANSGLWAGAGVCGAISKAAGKKVFDECQTILTSLSCSSIKEGECVMTTGGNLPQPNKAIIHAVGPTYTSDRHAEMKELLKNAYYNSLVLATGKMSDTYKSEALKNNEQILIETLRVDRQERDHKGHLYRTIAFPSISTGIFGFPLVDASRIAFEAIDLFLKKNPDCDLEEISFIFFPKAADKQKTAQFYEHALDDFISKKAV